MGVEENPRRLPALKEALMKIVLLVVGPLFIAVGFSGSDKGRIYSQDHTMLY
jgi:hypothetical protein